MPKQVAADRPPAQYWESRFRSTTFKRDVTALLERAIRSLAAARVKDVVDPALVRRLIHEWHGHLLNHTAIADVAIAAQRRAAGRAKTIGKSAAEFLDPRLVADIEALLTADVVPPADAAAFVGSLMQEEFVRGLFTDLIFTAIVAFNRRVNPLFGGLTTRLLEEQIKNFIRLFMPMLQQHAIAFALDADNQRMFLDVVLGVMRQLLAVPLRQYAEMISPHRRKQTEALIRTAAGNPRFESLLRTVSVAAWDDLYASIRDERIGDMLNLDAQAARLARGAAAVVIPLLSRPLVVTFVAAEMATAAPRRRRRVK